MSRELSSKDGLNRFLYFLFSPFAKESVKSLSNALEALEQKTTKNPLLTLKTLKLLVMRNVTAERSKQNVKINFIAMFGGF